MKKLYKLFIILLGAVLLFNACGTDALKDLNKNPKAANEIDMGYLMAYTQLQTSGERYENWRAVLIYSSTMIQHFAALPGYWSGDKYLYNQGYSASLWERGYTNYIKDLTWMISELKEDAEEVNNHSIARIWRVFAMHRMTDLYGDVPYSEAGMGYLDNIFTPKYDAQQSIYADMLNELEQAVAAFDASKTTFGSQDLVYGGDIDKWKKFANSMMLRLGMRMTKVDAGLAQQWVEKAITGGVMTSNDDNCYIEHTDGPDGINKNGIGEVFQVEDNPRMSKTFIDWMTTLSDPRIDVIAIAPEGGHKGMPNGYDATTIKDYEGTTEAVDIDIYSKVNPLLVNVASPMVFQTYAEVEFLLAEAAVRGWGASDAAAHYEAGVRAAMTQYGVFDASLVIADDAIDAYLAANAFDAGNAMKMIHEQYWACTFLNEYEAYANWRRTGIPELVSVNYPGNESNGTIPRRLRYPAADQSVNTANYEAAIAAQGADAFTTRMWWDAE